MATAIWKRPIRHHQLSEPAALRLLEASKAAGSLGCRSLRSYIMLLSSTTSSRICIYAADTRYIVKRDRLRGETARRDCAERLRARRQSARRQSARRQSARRQSARRQSARRQSARRDRARIDRARGYRVQSLYRDDRCRQRRLPRRSERAQFLGLTSKMRAVFATRKSAQKTMSCFALAYARSISTDTAQVLVSPPSRR